MKQDNVTPSDATKLVRLGRDHHGLLKAHAALADEPMRVILERALDAELERMRRLLRREK
jgi:hypothetical protein